jgi:hypothetical protein
VAVFRTTYFRAPNEADNAKILEQNSKRGFPRILGNIDCIKLVMKNCAFSWQGMYKGGYHGELVLFLRMWQIMTCIFDTFL